jgi:hypothetical protein
MKALWNSIKNRCLDNCLTGQFKSKNRRYKDKNEHRMDKNRYFKAKMVGLWLKQSFKG